MGFQQSFAEIQNLLTAVNHNSDLFVESLRQHHIFHLSFSQVSTVEFCQQRYYLQYILGQQPDPLPDYFTKGKLLHQLIARGYQIQMNGTDPSLDELEDNLAASKLSCDHAHLANALRVYALNRWQVEHVLAVEHPFVISIADDLPPLVGVIDLVLQDGDAILLVDHKTGRNFYPYDELQVAIYARYIQAMYPGYECRLYYDHYRWVNNLDRIRKPAFQRTLVALRQDQWQTDLQRINAAAGIIQQLHTGNSPTHTATCFRCPYQRICEFSYRRAR
ncbi:MAG: PD-(D/E)XK nuclease family protein [Chloroflexi bacterium]|nr:PD-(D/E)XK nuclease family protein [Chloroflexota bacterium]